MIDIDQFSAIELRTATVVSAERVPQTDKLIKLQVDLGGETRQMVAGIADTYEADELPGKKVVVVANLEPATIMGVESQGMVLAAAADGGPILVGLDRDVAEGVRVR